MASLFNIEKDADFRLEMEVDLTARPWQIGLIVGPSGSGKTSAAKVLFGGESAAQSWPNLPLIEAIAPKGNFDQVTGALAAVGLGSVPSWLRPFTHLSNGEQFRAGL
ncbi:ABC transporter ATP-binding protein, partial [Pseudorhodobacter sp. E13]